MSENLLLNRDSRYLAVPQLSFKTILLEELLLSGIHYQTPSPRWLRYHPSEASCLLHRACTHSHTIAAISTRGLVAIVIKIGLKNVFSYAKNGASLGNFNFV